MLEMSQHAYTPIRTKDVNDDVEAGAPRAEPAKSNVFLLGFIGAVSFAVVLFFIVIYANSGPVAIPADNVRATANFDEFGRFVMKDYDTAKPMSDFLSGLGGVWGVPMWAFFVNRGQGMTSFGKQNKDGSIEKFVTAEKAYQETPFTGFRTFVKGQRAGKPFTHMPFFPRSSADGEPDDVLRNMMIGGNEMEIEEIEPNLGLQTNVLYFTVPDEDYPSLIRRTTFTNLDPSQPLQIEVLDGLAKLIPAGLNNGGLDAMGRTFEAYMRVYNVGSAATGGGMIKEPFYHATQSTADTAMVSLVNDGQFVVAFIDDDTEVTTSADATTATTDATTATTSTVDAKSSGPAALGDDGLHPQLGMIVDPSVVFDTDTSLIEPRAFFSKDAPIMSNFLSLPQGTTARTPCAFAGAKLTIPGGKKVTITSVYGHAESLDNFVNKISPKVREPGYAASKRLAAQKLVEDITKTVVTSTSSPIFNDYIKQDYLDNILRGGLPIALGDSHNPKVFHTFSRIHGDIERDYNNFQIDTTYFSQGPGNFRDVSQNRRLDVLLAPLVRDFNVRMFLSFVQADAYNPLTVASTLFKVPAAAVESLVQSLNVLDPTQSGAPLAAVRATLSKPFRPGQFFSDVTAAGVKFGISREEVVNRIVAAAEQHFAAAFAQNGFWADHWTYTLDLVRNYLAVYPDNEEHLLWDAEPVTFFLSPAFVLPRTERFSLVDNPAKPGTSTIRVYKPLCVWGEPCFDVNLNNELLAIMASPDYVADTNGAGGMWMRNKLGVTFKVSPGAKLLMLGVLKFSSMDPYGMGVEMEGGKPGWNDAMNGLPGILGSGMPETYEMYQIIRFMNQAIKTHKRAVELPIEFVTFLDHLSSALRDFSESDKTQQAEFTYWNASNTSRETYRAATRVHFDGATEQVAPAPLSALLTAMENKVQAGIAKALATNDGYSPTYFSYECTDYKMLPPKVVTFPPNADQVIALSFVQHSLPLFLEGPTRHLKTIDTVDARRDVYQRTRNSDLYDSALQMYTLSASLKEIGPSVGRMVAFSPGWLENQSVWLHMSYKFYLELLRGGLYEEFFTEISTGLVPFMDSDVYGRSPLEAASFIVSSAFPDSKLHGQGFLARLSGSTAEFLSMWMLMMAGPAPFSLDAKGKLQLSFLPVIPGWMFPDNGVVSFTFLGAINVSYHNPNRVDTWTAKPTAGEVTYTDGTTATAEEGGVFGKAIAQDVRGLKVKSIVITY